MVFRQVGESGSRGGLFFAEAENDFSRNITIEKESGLSVSSKENGKLHGIVIPDAGDRKRFSLTVMMNAKSGVAVI